MGVRSIAKFIWQNPGNKRKRLRKFARALEWQLHKRIVRKPRILTLPNGVKFKAYPDCVISSALQYADWPEYAELHYCRSRLKPNDIVIDVGANVGHYSLLVADIVGPENLFCYEPAPVSWRRLVENFHLNGWPIDKLYQLALGRMSGTLQFADYDRPVTTNSPLVIVRERAVKVSVTTLDESTLSLKTGSVGLIKIDVEGCEPEVFAGGKRFFNILRPRIVMFESLSEAPDAFILEALEKSEYAVFSVDGRGNPRYGNLAAQNLFARDKHAIQNDM